MNILHFWRTEFKKNQLPKISMTKSQLKEELKLITEKKSTLPAMKRRAVIAKCQEKGITI